MDKLILEKINKLRKNAESEIIEYKDSNSKPDLIAQYISALSNSATILREDNAYMTWGIDDKTRNIIGTKFRPYEAKKGNENLIAWLERKIEPRIDFTFEETDVDSKHVVLLTIPATTTYPVGVAGDKKYVRSGSSNKPLDKFHNKEELLWAALSSESFEELPAKKNVTFQDINALLSIETYFELRHLPMPVSETNILDFLFEDNIIKQENDGSLTITNLGALSFARSLKAFPKLHRHALRVLTYSGTNKIDATSDYTGVKGYALGFQGLLDYVNQKKPKYEVYTGGNSEVGAKRVETSDYPGIALRELIANALVHQDFSISGVSPTVEIFSNRITITNPGHPLIDINRLMDYPPRSRNDLLATLFRNLGFIEERGSGIDKTVDSIEKLGLPAPRMKINGDFFEVTLFSRKKFDQLTSEDRLNATYLHASLKRLEEDFLTNGSLRKRFGLTQRESSKATSLINNALEANLINKFDEKASPKQMKYVPFWSK